MGKTLQERLVSAKASPTRVRTADYETLLADLSVERDRLKAQHAKDSADSICFTLAEADRAIAAERAASAARSIQGIEAEIADIRALHEQRVNSEKAAADELSGLLRWPSAMHSRHAYRRNTPPLPGR